MSSADHWKRIFNSPEKRIETNTERGYVRYTKQANTIFAEEQGRVCLSDVCLIEKMEIHSLVKDGLLG